MTKDLETRIKEFIDSKKNIRQKYLSMLTLSSSLIIDRYFNNKRSFQIFTASPRYQQTFSVI